MKKKSLWKSGPYKRLILALLFLALFLLIPGTETRADSNAPTVTNTPEATNTPIPEPPTQTPAAPVEPTNTPFTIPPTEIDENQGAIAIATPPPGTSGGLSTINRILLVVLGISVVVIIGVIVYIFINQARDGLGER